MTLRAYTRVPAGPSWSTVLPDLDFESFSEAGYYWDGPARRWRGISGGKTNKGGISEVGAVVYTEHPSCEVLSLAYDLKDGRGDHLWTPGMPPPVELFQHIAAGGLLEAWNSSFEFWLWHNVCHARMGWPALPYWQLRCAMSKARAFSLPGALGDAAKAINVGAEFEKDAKGKALLRLVSIPQKPTAKQIKAVEMEQTALEQEWYALCEAKHVVTLAESKQIEARCFEIAGRLGELADVLPHVNRATPATHPEKFQETYAYNRQDIKAESAVSVRCPDLSQRELELWLLDQLINLRGVHIDQDALQNCIAIVQAATAKYTAELQAITGGIVRAASEVAEITRWVGTQGLHLSNLDADVLEECLKRTDLTPSCRRVLEIRDMLGAASVKKLFAIERRLSRSGRLMDLFAFCGADRSGRWAGRGPQPQNLPAGGPKVVQCGGPGGKRGGCGRVFWKGLALCPECGKVRGPDDGVDWGIDAVEAALRDIATRSLEHVEAMWGDAVAAVSGCLRGLFAAAPGHDLICSDFSAIEAVVLAELAGEEWRQEVFRTHGKIYEMSAAKITGIAFDEFMEYKKRHGQHHPMRKKVGKVAELGCFTPDTRLLTRRGYVSIAALSLNDELWDGEEWVKHEGVVHKGRKRTITVDGVRVTPEHPISLGRLWKGAGLLASSKSTLLRALGIGSESLPLSAKKSEARIGACSSPAPAGAPSSLCPCQISTAGSLQGAENVGGQRLKRPTLNYTPSTRTSSPTQSTAGGSLTAYAPLSHGATAPLPKGTRTTGAAVSQCATPGARTRGPFSRTFLRLTGGTSRILKWTGKIRIRVTSPEISALSPDNRTCSISAPCPRCSNVSSNSRHVYDITNAGPRHRFTIKTATGHLIVHNSGYGGGWAAWCNFGADEFMDEQEGRRRVWDWREASPAIAGKKTRRGEPEPAPLSPERGFWYGLQDAAYMAVQNPGHVYTYQARATKFTQPPPIQYFVHQDILYCVLPSGRMLTYHQPRLTQELNQFNGRTEMRLTYWGHNSDGKKGPVGWMKLDTWGGKLCENICQAVARDILAHSLPALERGGYPVVLHVHDEVVSEVPASTGNVKEFERIMGTMPEWAKEWPIRAAGGWRGTRYRKD